jgi:hypothetical protein
MVRQTRAAFDSDAMYVRLLRYRSERRPAFPLEEALRSATPVKSAFHKLDRRTTIDLSL